MEQNTNQQGGNETFVALTADIVSAFAGSQHNRIEAADLPALITSVFGSLSSLGQTAQVEPQRQEPAVSIRSSIKPDYVVCLEDGKKLKMLKRHLMTHYNLTPDQYRQKWGLNADYPMVAPNYAEQRRALAKKIGLGTTRTRSTEGRGRRASTASTGSDNAGGEQAAPRGRGRPSNASKAAAAAKGGRGKKSEASS